MKQSARLFRKKEGLSYKEISSKLGIAKSTAKLWCEDIKLSVKQRERLYTKQIEILNQGPNCSHLRRKAEVDNIISNAEEEVELPMKVESLRLAGAALYWAEGEKSKHFSIANSDPHLIKFTMNWLKNTLDVSPERIKAHLNIYSQQSESQLKKFWSEATGIPLINFGKGYIKPKIKITRRIHCITEQ